MLLGEKETVLPETDKHWARKSAAPIVHVKSMAVFQTYKNKDNFHSSIELPFSGFMIPFFISPILPPLNSHFREVTEQTQEPSRDLYSYFVRGSIKPI